MIIDSKEKVVDLDNGRACSICAVGATYKLDIKTLSKAALLTGNVNTNSSDAVQNSLASAGFQAASPLINLDNIQATAKTRAETLLRRNKPIAPNFTQLTFDVEDGEDLVALEFHPITGEIIDWYQPVSHTIPPLSTMMPFSTSLEVGAVAQSKQAVFKIPLHSTYSSEPKAYSLTAGYLPNPKKMLKKVIRVFAFKKLKQYARVAIAKVLKGPIRKLDQRFVKKDTLGLFTTRGAPRALTTAQKKKLTGSRGLLFVHGIISKTTAAFGGIQQDRTYYKELKEAYDGNLLAYDHWTLSKDVFKNAEELAKKLPKSMEIDIVCHSRGAAVVRSLLELPRIQEILENKNIKAGRVVFVAGACEGSQLATGNALDNIFTIFNKMGLLLGNPAFGTGILGTVIKLVLGGLQELPGTDSMDPKGKYIQTLRESTSTLADRYSYFRANFDPGKRSLAAVDQQLVDKAIFGNKANDVIVPFAGAGPSENYLKGKVDKRLVKDYGSANDPQSAIWHINFFKDECMRKRLMCELIGET